MTHAVKNEVGNNYGKLAVIRQDGRDRGGQALWLCKCTCGNICTVRGTSLRGGHTKSCGCISSMALKAKALPVGQAAFNQLFTQYRCRAERKGIKFDLTKEDFSFLTRMNCFYCGTEPSQRYSSYGRFNGGYQYNGIDRVDSSGGYTLDNVVPCCVHCNRAKSDMTTIEFFNHIKNIYNYRIHKEQGDGDE